MSRDLPPVLGLLELASNPIVVFNVGGRVTFANQAARTSPLKVADVVNNHPSIRDLAYEVSNGTMMLPQDMVIEASTADGPVSLRGSCVTGPAGVDIAFVMKSSSADGGTMSIKEIVSLIQFDMAPSIQRFFQKWESLRKGPVADDALIAQAAALTNRLERMEDLVQVFSADVLPADEPLRMPEMVRSVIQSLVSEANRNQVSFSLTGSLKELPPVNGSQRLIRRALYELIENAIKHARRFTPTKEPLTVQVAFALAGAFLSITVKNLGVAHPEGLGQDAFRLFPKDPNAVRKSTVLNGRSSAHALAYAAPRPAAPQQPTLKIGLPLVQRIVHLHEGSIEVENHHEEGFSITVRLPTGPHQRVDKAWGFPAAHDYAADLVKALAQGAQTEGA